VSTIKVWQCAYLLVTKHAKIGVVYILGDQLSEHRQLSSKVMSFDSFA